MPIEKIPADDLRDMEHQEGLVLQGCGGEAQEWLDGINDLLTQDGILQNGSRFETVKVFQHDGLNNLLFPFENIQVDMGKLAMWRLQTHGAFGGTWLSDYLSSAGQKQFFASVSMTYPNQQVFSRPSLPIPFVATRQLTMLTPSP